MVFNGAQFHFLVNHLPVIGFIGMLPALVVAIKVSSIDIKRFVLLATFVVGLSALAPYWTGEPAEEVIEDLPGVSKDLIHEHEELAELATVLSLVTALAAGGAVFAERKRPGTFRVSVPAVLLLSLVTAGVMGATAHAGGKIRHPEINSAASNPLGAQNGTSKDLD